MIKYLFGTEKVFDFFVCVYSQFLYKCLPLFDNMWMILTHPAYMANAR